MTHNSSKNTLQSSERLAFSLLFPLGVVTSNRTEFGCGVDDLNFDWSVHFDFRIMVGQKSA